MPQAIAAVVEFAITAVEMFGPALAGSFGLGSQITAGIIAVGGLAGAEALTAPSMPDAVAAKTPFRQEMPPRKTGWGYARIGGAYMLYEGNGTNAWLAQALHDGRVTGFDRFYLNDDWVTVDGSGWVNGRWHLDDDLTSSTYGTLIFVNDGQRYTPEHVKILSRIGLATETAYAELVASVPQFWTAQHRGDGIASIAVLCNQGAPKYFTEDYPNGLPQPSAVMKLKPVWDPRDPDQDRANPDTWVWSANWLLCTLDYLMHDPHGPMFDYTRRIAPVLENLKAEADYCDDPIPLKAGGTEPRYRVGGAYDHDNHPADVIKQLLACADGFMSLRGDGALILKAGRYDVPTVTLTDQHILSCTWSRFTPDEQAVNELVVSFTSPEHDYSMPQTDSWVDQDDKDARGVTRSQPLQLPWVQSNGQARRLAKRKMAQLGANIRGVLKTNLYGLDSIDEERYFNIATSKVACLNGLAAEVDPAGKAELDLNTLTLSIPFIAADPNIDAWSPETEEGDGVPLVPRSSVESLSPPTILSATPVFDSAGDGAGVRLQVTLENPGRGDQAFGLRWKVSGNVSWVESSYAGPYPTTGDIVLETGFVTGNATLEVSAELLSGSGAYSEWSDPPVSISTATDARVPDALTGLAVSSWDAALTLVCTPVERARTYSWSFYKSDGVTLIKTYTTASPTFSYTAAQAGIDGVQRAYVIKAAGVNGAGAGVVQTITAAKAAPIAVIGADASGSTGSAGIIAFTPESGEPGYVIAYSDTAVWDASTYGGVTSTGVSPGYLASLPAGTYYAKVAAYDAWSRDPALLNFSAVVSFTLTGTSLTPPGGGGGAAGGGGRDGGFAALP